MDISSILPQTYRQTEETATADDVRRIANRDAITTGGNSTLGQEEFFKLLTTQLTNQNPLEPMKDTEFIAQMASFSSLEQMKQLNDQFKLMLDTQTADSAQAYLGRVVTVNSGGAEVEGLVTEVNRNAEGVYVILGENRYAVDEITGVRLPTEP